MQSQNAESRSHKERTNAVLATFRETSLALFMTNHGMMRIDGTVVLLGDLGVEVDEDDWTSFKSHLVFALSQDQTEHENIIENHGGNESQVPPEIGSELPSDPNIDDDNDNNCDSDGTEEHDTIEALRQKVKGLEATLQRKNMAFRVLQLEKKHLQQKVRRLHTRQRRQERKHQEEVAKLRDEINSSFAVSRTSSRPKAWITPQGCVAIALRRNIGNVSCALLGHVVLQDVAGCTVSRCEIKTGAALIASAQAFYQYFQHSLDLKKVESDPPFVVHSVREDATNSGIWKKSKLAAMEIESFFSSTMSSYANAVSSGHHLRQLADVQRVIDGTALGTLALYMKQMQSIGCPTWFELTLA